MTQASSTPALADAGDDDDQPAQVSERLAIEWWGDIVPRSSGRWLVDELIPANGLVALIGSPGAGKSFLALDLAAHIAAGRQWFGRKTSTGLVVYVAAEDPHGLRLRVAALRDAGGFPAELPLALLTADFDLRKAGDIRRLTDHLRVVDAAASAPLALVIIDTLSRTFGDGDENTADMAGYVRQLGQLQSALACSVMVLHHPPKNAGGKSPRGHSSLPAACDTILLITGRTSRRLTVDKQRNARSNAVFGFELRPLKTGSYETCSIEPAPASGPIAVAGRIGEDERVMIEQLAALAQTEGVPPPDEWLSEAGATTSGDVYLVDGRRWEANSRSALRSADRQSDSIRRAVQRGRERLIKGGIVGCWRNWTWLIA
jgi:hypothetical protein